jgi:hypothetical protein
MSQFETTLKKVANGAVVGATIHDLLSLETLFHVEEQWGLARIEVLRELAARRVDRNDWPQSIHWSWAYKAATLEESRLEASGDLRLFGIEAENEWQGLLCAMSEGYQTRLGTPDQPLVYIDYLESAPWNWEIGPIKRFGCFRGVGVQLMEAAVRWSMALGYNGRVGLHALPQAEGFYQGRCRMENLGVDVNYHDLCYFEFDESQVSRFLRS